MAISIYSIIEGLTVDSDDIVEAEAFTEQYLSAQFPTYDFRQGTALRDMTVRPNATLLALVNKAIQHYFDDTDVMNITDSTDNDIADEKLSNFFVTRKSGDNTVIKARMYFSFPTVTPIATIIPSSATFSPDNDLQYSTSADISVNPDPGTGLREDGKYYFSYDGSSDTHYVDVELTASEASEDYNLEEGELLYFTIFSPYFIQGSIMYLVSTAIETETNEEMVARAPSAISTRNLINSPSIEFQIGEQFNYVREVYSAGLGNDDLYRDLITIDSISTEDEAISTQYHRGGHVDVYCDTELVTQRLQFTLDDSRGFTVTGPVLYMTRSSEAQSGEEDDTAGLDEQFAYDTNASRYVDGVPDDPATDLGLSARQVTTVTFAFATPGQTVTMDITSFSGLGSIEDAINSTAQRVVCADYLVRAFEPVFINIAVDVRDGTYINEATEAITEYIDGISAGGIIYMAHIVSAIQNSGLTNFVMPISVEAVTKSRRREYNSVVDVAIDETVEIVTDSFNLRTNQQFYVGTVTLTEV